MLTEKEILDKLQEYKTVGVNVVVTPYFEKDALDGKISNFNRDHIRHGKLPWLYRYTKKLKSGQIRNEDGVSIEDQINEEISEFTDPTRLNLYIFKNTSIEELSEKCEIIDKLLNNLSEGYEESEIFKEIAKVFKIKPTNLRNEQKSSRSIQIGDSSLDDDAVLGQVISKTRRSAPTYKGYAMPDGNVSIKMVDFNEPTDFIDEFEKEMWGQGEQKAIVQEEPKGDFENSIEKEIADLEAHKMVVQGTPSVKPILRQTVQEYVRNLPKNNPWNSNPYLK